MKEWRFLFIHANPLRPPDHRKILGSVSGRALVDEPGMWKNNDDGMPCLNLCGKRRRAPAALAGRGTRSGRPVDGLTPVVGDLNDERTILMAVVGCHGISIEERATTASLVLPGKGRRKTTI